jgi:hypothetical protein
VGDCFGDTGEGDEDTDEDMPVSHPPTHSIVDLAGTITIPSSPAIPAASLHCTAAILIHTLTDVM